MKKKEHIINVPVEPELKPVLERQADKNGRAVRREAAAILNAELRKKVAK